jgi:hypothetical protein
MARPEAQPLERELERISSSPANPDPDHFHDRALPQTARRFYASSSSVRVSLRRADVDWSRNIAVNP